MDIVLAMAGIDPRDRLAYWYDIACKVFVDHECVIRSPLTFDVSLEHSPLGELGIVNIDSHGMTYTARTARTIAHDEDDVFFLCLQRTGSATLIQNGREATIHPGDFTVVDAQRPYDCHYPEAWSQIIIKIPHRPLKARLGSGTELTGLPVRRSDPLGGIASGYLAMIPDRVDRLPSAAESRIAEHMLDLTALALAAEVGHEKPAISSGSAIELHRLRLAIESRLGDPVLDPGSAAAAAGVSVRHANKLLSRQGTSLQQLITSRRLDYCRRALEDASQSHHTITAIAFAWGFADVSHFNRSFKAEYGCAPRDYRQRFHAP